MNEINKEKFAKLKTEQFHKMGQSQCNRRDIGVETDIMVWFLGKARVGRGVKPYGSLNRFWTSTLTLYHNLSFTPIYRTSKKDNSSHTELLCTIIFPVPWDSLVTEYYIAL